MTRTRTLAAAGALLAVGTLAGCGQDGTITLPSQLPSSLPSVSVPSSLPSVEVPTAMPSVSVPSISVPTPTRTRTPAETTAPTKTSEPAPSQSGTDEAGASMEPSKTPTETPTQTQTPTTKPTTPTATPTETVTVTATPTPSATPTSASPSASPTSASPSASASAAPSASVTPEPTSSSGTPWWPWLLLGLVVLAGLIWFFARRSRGNSWDDRLAVERTQAQWVLAELLTVVTDPAGTPSAQSVQWSSAQPTLDQLDKGLADLIATAPDEDRRGTATALSKSLADVRNAVGTDLALRSGTSPIPADPASLGTSAAAVQSARDRFAAALANATPAPDGNGSSTPPPAA